MKSGFSVLLLVLMCIGLEAQQDSWLSLRYSRGVFLPHRVSLPQLRTDNTSGLELSYTRAMDGSKDWHHHFRGPRKGIGIYALDMGNPEELGSIFSVYPFVDLPLDKQGPGRIILHMGVGLAYLDKRFDFEENFFNKAIGSHLNYGIVMALHYEYQMDRLKCSTGISMTHASNAAIQLPNLGVNVASLDLSLSYRLNKEKQDLIFDPERKWQREQSFLLMTSFGLRESNVVTRDKHGVQELRGIYSKKFSAKSSYRLGFDLIHNRSTYLDLDDGRTEEFGIDAIQSGLFMGITLDFGNALMYLHNGFYLTQGFQDQGFIYHRFGGMWKMNEKLSLDLSLKTHFAKADYLALGLGYSLASKKISKDG